MAARRAGGGGARGGRGGRPAPKVVRPHGQLRRSQVIGGAGPGAMLDLPRHAVIVGGLEDWGDPWVKQFERIDDERVRARLEKKLGIPGLQLFSPPVEGDTFGQTLKPGLTVWQFPEWFIAQAAIAGSPGIRPLIHRKSLQQGQYLDDDGQKHKVVPVRFVRACQNGHLDDIDWVRFAHRDQKRNCGRKLLWVERGASSDFVDIFVECECKEFGPRSLIEATKFGALGRCFGKRPWLQDEEGVCQTEDGKPIDHRLLVRNASNAYFSIVDRSISIPEPDQELRAAVGKVHTLIMNADSEALLDYERKKPQVQAAIGRFKNADVLADLQRRKDAGVDARKQKYAEFDTFLAVNGQEGVNTPNSTFFAREQVLPSPRPAVLKPFSKVLKVERLREVSVMRGFTRFQAPSTDIDGELDLDVRLGALAREVKWLPAVENRGEGLFFGFDRDTLNTWAKQKRVKDRRAQLEAGWAAWAGPRKIQRAPPPIEYVFLHSLSHLLLTQLSLDCGYAASSIRERIYVEEEGAGILLHTGTPDAEGTLGGLVNAARNLESLVRGALELGAFCSNDPVCSQHRFDDTHEERFLHGAACHGCLLIPETSCELRNDLLDRALVVETVDSLGCHLFDAP